MNLYAKHKPDKLLPFLKRSHNYPIQEAFDICKRELFYPEMVYLLGRMGNTREALFIIIHNIKNIQMAIEFCKENDDADLWNDLINQSLDQPQIMTKLLDGIAGEFIVFICQCELSSFCQNWAVKLLSNFCQKLLCCHCKMLKINFVSPPHSVRLHKPWNPCE